MSTSYQKVIYSGKLEDYQRNPKRFQTIVYEQDPYNSYQNFLYKRALFGLSIYNEEELIKMHNAKKKRIQSVHERSQRILNAWKQKLSHEITSKFLTQLFHHSKFVKDYAEKFAEEIDSDYISRIDFKSLGVTKRDIIDKLIEERILPHNFYQLA